jgi:hypothetical protein
MVFLFVLIILLLRSIVELNNKRIDVAKLHKESETEKIDLQEKVARAKEKNQNIRTDRGFDAYVRTTYPVVADGEGVIVVYDSTGSPVTPVREDITIWEHLLLLWNKLFKHQT